uniref:Chitin-binding protein n=1 Tax=Macrobrachium nipponense TaxID=159736 RepID=A0A1S6R4T6_MACNP|nr:chitin-binding protein [Macrobrachium nipponense]
MKTFMILMAAVACQASVLPYSVVPSARAIVHADSLSPAVMKIPEPGIRFNVPKPATYASRPVIHAPAPFLPAAYSAPVPVVARAPVPVAAPVVYSAPVLTVPAAAVAVVAAPGEPFVEGQSHAQDETVQYSLGHWGGPSPPQETRGPQGAPSAASPMQYNTGHFGGPNPPQETRDSQGAPPAASPTSTPKETSRSGSTLQLLPQDSRWPPLTFPRSSSGSPSQLKFRNESNSVILDCCYVIISIGTLITIQEIIIHGIHQ